MRPALNDFPASHPQRANASSFKNDGKDLGQSKSMGTALLKHKIQSHLKNRLLTPLKDQRPKENRKQTQRNDYDQSNLPICPIVNPAEQVMKEKGNE